MTIKVDAVEKGTFLQDRIEARCFRIKSRRSNLECYTPSGNYPIPDAGTHVRAYLYGPPDPWNVIFPNGLASPDPDTELADASQLKQLRSGGFTYVLPGEIWVLVLISVVLGKLLQRRLKKVQARHGDVGDR